MSNSSVCWFPDGQTNGKTHSPQFVPCNPAAPHSQCCAIGETCTGSGLCLSGNGLIYRGGCTDITFKDSSCPKNCLAATGPFAGSQNAFEFLKPCSAANSLSWVCGLDGDCLNSTKNFGLIVGNPTALKITGNLSDSPPESSTLPTLSSATFITPTFTASTASSSNTSCSPKPATVGAAVGIPLGLLLLIISCLYFLELRRRKTKSLETSKDLKDRQDKREAQTEGLKGWQAQKGLQTHEVSSEVMRSELGTGERKKMRTPKEMP